MSANAVPRPYYSFGWKPSQAQLKAHDVLSAERDCQYMLPTLIQLAEAKPDLKLLDVGCGPGSITNSLSFYLPEGHVTGIDYSEAMLEKARQQAQERGIENVTYQQANVYTLPFPDETFDVLHTHQAVAHFKEHITALKEMLRVTKKGGLLCMRECDLYSARFYPASPMVEESWQKFIESHEKQGLHCNGGLRLKSWTKEAGAPEENISLTFGSWSFGNVEERRGYNGARLWQPPLSEKAVELGVATQ
jgi:SAM-dependent methyltransferase